MDLPFHPHVAAWFTAAYGEPTAVQAAAWPLIAEGRHVLALAPTGSGKTLTAFLSAISRFCRGTYPADTLSVLYISPLKALNEDIRRNLLEPLAGIRRVFEEAGDPFPPITVETRSGDTPQSERRRFYRHPPSILVTTPESLALLLLNPRGRETLSALRCVILDEIHSVLGTKRGSFLCCQIDRLSLILRERGEPELLRIGLSATVNPPEVAAEFLGGLRPPGAGGFPVPEPGSPGDGSPRRGSGKKAAGEGVPGKDDPVTGGNGVPDSEGYETRPVRIVAPRTEKDLIFTVEETGEDPALRILRRVEANRTTLVFTGSRRGAEQLSYRINQAAGRPLSFAHHGSLSKELRRAVEQGLAEGKIPCVVATSSLELGIDIGSVDEVILAGSPPSAAAALQRIGRSGHGVGRTSRGRFIPLRGSDLLTAAALDICIRNREIEAIRPVENPLDLLAQIILALCDEEDRRVDELYHLLRGFYAFRTLSRPAYDSVLRMLAGYGRSGYDRAVTGPGARLRDLNVRLYWDKEQGLVSAAPGTRMLLYASGGVIPSRGLYSLRLAEGKLKIGEIDEEFVWERRLGDSFSFGNRSWQIVSIGPEAVEVVPRDTNSDFIPFWRADPLFRGSTLSRRILEILDVFTREGELSAACLPGFSPAALADLNRYLDSQRRAQGPAGDGVRRAAPLPGLGCIPAEIVEKLPGDGYVRGAGSREGRHVLLHSFWGGAVNYPLCLAVAQELEDRTGERVESFSDDNTILFLLPGGGIAGPRDLEDLVAGILRGLNGGGEKGLFPGPGTGAGPGTAGTSGAAETTGGAGAAPSRPPAPRLTGLSRGEQQFLRRLESGSRFGAAFREAAERSLVQPRGAFGKRLPLWIIRQKAKHLFDSVRGEEDFPLIAEAWRSCLRDDVDMGGFRNLIGALDSGAVAVPFFHTLGGSPFARNVIWQETNTLLYETDERRDLRARTRGRGPAQGFPGSLSPAGSSLSDRVIAEALGNSSLRPVIPRELARGFAARLRRELPGWAPEDSRSLAEWVKERIAVPADEWEVLFKVLPSPLLEELEQDPGLGGKLRSLTRRGAALACVVHREWEKSWLQEAPSLMDRWLRFQGPLPLSRLGAVFGLDSGELEDTVNALAREETAAGPALIRSVAVEGLGTELVCDTENLDLLLRLKRAGARPRITERPASLLVPFLALRQGWSFGELPAAGDMANGTAENTVHGTAGTKDRTRAGGPSTEPLPNAAGGLGEWAAGLNLPVKLWEEEILTARQRDYRSQTLEDELRQGWLLWYGTGKDQAAFCRPEDLDLTAPETGTADSGESPFPPGFFEKPRDYWEIKDACGTLPPGRGGDRTLIPALWEQVQKGRLSSDSWEALRRGILGDTHAADDGTPGAAGPLLGEAAADPPFDNSAAALFPYRRIPPALRSTAAPYGRTALRNRWRQGPPVPGRWFSLDRESLPGTEDPWYQEELDRERVRLLLRRWGVLCRPLLERENGPRGGPLSWARLLPAMRRMELAGELTAGYFFSGVASLQFASPAILRELEEAEGFDRRGAGGPLFWMNAVDPASPAGLAVEGLDPRLPARSPRNRLYYRGAGLIAVSKRNGKELDIFIPPKDPALGELTALIKVPRQRSVNPEKKLVIETINKAPAAASPYGPPLIEAGFIPDRGKLYLW
jgi:ATP-dependent Lhr-like helicase